MLDMKHLEQFAELAHQVAALNVEQMPYMYSFRKTNKLARVEATFIDSKHRHVEIQTYKC